MRRGQFHSSYIIPGFRAKWNLFNAQICTKKHAEIVNAIDEAIERDFSDYKRAYRGFHKIDARNERVEGYFYYAFWILNQLSNGFYEKNKIKPYIRAREEWILRGVDIFSDGYNT